MLDVIIKNGCVVDGSDNPWFKADIAIQNGKIVKVCNISSGQTVKVIDATGLVVSPGFIDIHDHSDFNLLANPLAESKIRQGVTTEVNGNCGLSAAPLKGASINEVEAILEKLGLTLDWHTFAGYFDRLERQGIALNVASLVGHGTLRQSVMGDAPRLPTSEELGEMKALVAQAMEEGAFGLSSGLEFVPGIYSDVNELIELCKVVAKYGGIYATHQRNRDLKYEEATTEAIEIGEKAGIPVHLSHFVVRFPGEGKTPVLLWMVDEARKRGIDVTCDVITPNTQGGYHLGMQQLAIEVIPPWGFEGGLERTLERLRDPKIRERFKKEHVPQWKLFSAGKWDRLILNYCRANPNLIGKTFAEIAKIRKVDPWDVVFDILLAEGEHTGSLEVSILGGTTAERDSLMVMKHPTASICSDRAVFAPYGTLAEAGWPNPNPDPNSYGAFPRIFRRQVREQGLLNLEEAVKKMTSLSARSLGLRDRGLIREGMWADIVVFSSEEIADKATNEEPAKYPEGIEYVLVNGEVVIDRGEHTGALPGKVLKKTIITHISN